MLRHLWSKKLSLTKAALLPILFLSLQCQQPAKRNEAKVTPVPELKSDRESFLIEDGESSQAVFSPDGRRLLFVSRARIGHQQAQIYEKDLVSGQETRITFQNGDTSSPHYHNKEDVILYASSTDELKENPPLLKPVANDPKIPASFQEPTEIYVHSLKGLEITRLTDSPGFDGDPIFSADGQSVIFSRARDEKLEVVAIDRRTHNFRLIKGLGVNPAQYTIAPDKKWRAWVDWDKSFGVAKLKVQKFSVKKNDGEEAVIEVVPDRVVPKTDLVFAGESKWLFWAQLNPTTNTYQLWSLELEKMCARPLSTIDDSDRRHPALSPDLKRLVYTVARKGRSRIAQVGFTPPTGPCVPTK